MAEVNWEKHYRACRVELEMKEKVWSKRLNTLQKGLLQLSFQFKGQDQQLDGILKTISDILRSGKNDQAIDSSFLTVLRLIGEHTASHKLSENDIALSTEAFSNFLQQIPSDVEMLAEAQVLISRINSCADQTEFESLVEETALFLSTRLKEGNASPLTNVDGSELYPFLVRLLEKISFPKELLPRVSKAKAILLRDTETASLESALTLVADLFTTLQNQHNKETDDISSFLKQVAEQLNYVHKHLDKSHTINMEGYDDTLGFSQSLEDTFGHFQHSIEEANSMEMLKAEIESHIDSLKDNVTAYIEKEEGRMRMAEETMDLLSLQIGDLQSEANQLKVTVEKEQEKSLTDALTSLGNRRAFEERMAAEYARWQRHEHRLSIIIIDLDKFKSINDNYGHNIGDKILKGVASTLKQDLRQSDFLARFGGEEFVVILPDTELKEAMMLAEKLRKRIQTCNFNYKNESIPVTISSGITEFSGNTNIETAFELADKALYLAKESGRNQCQSSDQFTADFSA